MPPLRGYDVPVLPVNAPPFFHTTSMAMITMTPAAAEAAIQQMGRMGFSEEVHGLRVGVLPGGCSGFQYMIEVADAPEADDVVLESEGVRLFVDPFSLQYVGGMRIDYVESFQGSGFVFENPNASGGCGCGSSFNI